MADQYKFNPITKKLDLVGASGGGGGGSESTANKTDNIAANAASSIKYPSTKGTYDWVTSVLGKFKTDDVTYNAGWSNGNTLVMSPNIVYKVQNNSVGTDKLHVSFGTAVDGDQFMITDGSVNGNINSLVWITGQANVTPRIVLKSNETLIFTKSDGIIWLTSRTNKSEPLSYTTENVANKATDFTVSNNTLYPTTQAVTNYLDQRLNGLNWKFSVTCATAAALPTCTLDVTGKIITASANGALPLIDGYNTTINDGIAVRILVKNEANQFKNGVYSITQQGTAGTPFILTRTSDCDTSLEIAAATVYVRNGSTEISRVYTVVYPSSDYTVPIGTVNIQASLVNSAITYTNGAGLTLIGNTFSIAAGAITNTMIAPMTSAQLATIVSDETGTGALVFATSPTLTTPTINGGNVNLMDYLGCKDTAVPAYNLRIKATSSVTATTDSYLTIDVKNTSRTISLGGNITLAGAFATSGTSDITLTSTATTNVTLPTTGTLSTLTGSETLTNKTLTTPSIASIKGTLTVDTDGATVTFNKNTSDTHNVVLGGNRTLAVSNMAAGDKMVIRLTQDGTGSRTVTWFSTIKWAGGVVPTLTTAINKADMFGFLCTSAGNYDGFVIGQNI